MRIENVPFAAIRWEGLPAVTLAGRSGFAAAKTVQLGDICLRKIEFTARYCADDWCSKGHIGFVLAGSLLIRLERGDVFEIAAGDSFQIGDGQDRHRTESPNGSIVLVVD